MKLNHKLFKKARKERQIVDQLFRKAAHRIGNIYIVYYNAHWLVMKEGRCNLLRTQSTHTLLSQAKSAAWDTIHRQAIS